MGCHDMTQQASLRLFLQSCKTWQKSHTKFFNSFTVFFKSDAYLHCYGLSVPSPHPAGRKESKGNQKVNISIII